MGSQEPTISLDDCLKLLRGERDEQRLAGLLLATKLCKGDDHDSIIRIYDAVGATFLNRLFNTGMGRINIGTKEGGNQEAYLQLSVTVLAAICRVPEIASTKDMVDKVPLVLEILSKGFGPSIFDECYEFLLLVSSASKDGVSTLYKSGGLHVLASLMSSLGDGSQSLELTMRLVQLILSEISLDLVNNEYSSQLSHIVAVISKQFALLHNALKFEVLRLLSSILSSSYAVPLHDALRLIPNDYWATYIRVGVVEILQNRVASTDRLQALVLAESMITIKGEGWLIDPKTFPDEKSSSPVDRCLLLVLESSRVEVAVLLNELAYLRDKALKSSSTLDETKHLKQRDLGIAYSLIEKIIKLVSNVIEDEENPISESTSMKIISGLNETVDVVLEFLQDAKDHGQWKGDDLLASVRITGRYILSYAVRYLAEAPLASKKKVQGLLDYIFSIRGEDESSPFYSICFFLPYLSQITKEIEGCRTLASFDGHKVNQKSEIDPPRRGYGYHHVGMMGLNGGGGGRSYSSIARDLAVVICLVNMIHLNHVAVEDSSTIFLACDTILNFLLKQAEIQVQLNGLDFVHLLSALADCTADLHDPSFIMTASSICSLIFESTSEKALLTHPDFNLKTLNSLSNLISRSLKTDLQGGMLDDTNADEDLHHIVTAGCARWSRRFPILIKGLES
ncbi:hypothetical protein GIB67_031614 [Kingdonia uniflora]|uniref:Neurochondrin n=1 Tax=Kingdonia uniflora TaxID=39325 RepID=A0A7J7LYD4_9MAGN|nr:hypothetical protein GIB67_031614 [Kingdonia uniflora]